MKKLSTARDKKGFTLLELTVSLFLLGILTLLLMLVLQTTLSTSRNFLDFTNYEYALAHKKIFEIYTSSEKVERESNYIIMTLSNKEEDAIVFRGDSVYLEKQKSRNYYAGYILLLKKLKSYKIEQNGKMVHVALVDRENHERNLYIKLKEKKEEHDKDKKDSEGENNSNKEADDKDDKG